MVTATFGKGAMLAAAEGAVQYDRGQKIYVYGLSGRTGETLEVQYAYAGDAQSESRVAEWNAAEKAWVASIPNYYLTLPRAVSAYIYVTQDEMTASTQAIAVFTPMARSRPSDSVTEEQGNAWAELVLAVNTAIANANAAASNANSAAGTIGSAIGTMNAALEEWAPLVEQASADAEAAAESAEAAQEATSSMIYQISAQTVTIGTEGWAQNASGLYEKSVSVTGMTANGRMQWSVNGGAIGVVLIAGARCDTDGAVTLVSMNVPSAEFTMSFSVEGVRA